MSPASNKKESALNKVQNLYLMQVELWNFLDARRNDPDAVKSAKKTLRDFQELLDEVDWQYMGGEDVLESLQWIPGEVKRKLKDAPATKRVAKKPAKKPARAAKATAKKATAKKVTKKKVTKKKK